jgi:hypothetical protein
MRPELSARAYVGNPIATFRIFYLLNTVKLHYNGERNIDRYTEVHVFINQLHDDELAHGYFQ